MSDKNMARRTEIQIDIDGVDISADINKYLISMTYTDNEEDKTDDLQITIDDREGLWLGDWLNTSMPSAQSGNSSGDGWQIGDTVIVNGQPQYGSYGDGKPGKRLTDYGSKITYLNLKSGVPYPIHVDAKGWFAESNIQKSSGEQEAKTGSGGGIKGAKLHAVAVQKNWDSSGKDNVLDCGTFEIDSLDVSGPPTKVTIKGTSLPLCVNRPDTDKNEGMGKYKAFGDCE